MQESAGLRCAKICAVIVRTADGLIVTLDEKHWTTHIVAHHPELADHWNLVIETLKTPEGVYRSKRDMSTRIYMRGFYDITISDNVFERMPLLVHVREAGGFVVTAYFAAALWRSLGEQLWPL